MRSKTETRMITFDHKMRMLFSVAIRCSDMAIELIVFKIIVACLSDFDNPHRDFFFVQILHFLACSINMHDRQTQTDGKLLGTDIHHEFCHEEIS